MRFHRVAIKVAEAQARIAQYTSVGEREEVSLEQSFGRRLAESVYADHPVPHFRRSGLDGFAVRAGDTHGAKPACPIKLEVIESIPCGCLPTKPISSGQAARIMTGAAMPEGADAVIMLEMTEEEEKEGKLFVLINKEMTPGDHVTPAGFEIEQGELIMEKGDKLRAGEIALLATFGHSRVNVFKQPRIAILTTGSELLPVEAPLQPGKIRNSNAFMLAAQVREAGGVPIMMGSVADDVALARDGIMNGLNAADMVVTSGGVSVGDSDIMVDLFEQWEGTVLFNKIAMRPGSPTTVGICRHKFVFALSGNPGACFVGFELFVRPVIAMMQGMLNPVVHAAAYLHRDFMKPSAYPRYVRGRSFTEQGKIFVEPAGADKSSIVVSIKDSNCLIIVPAGGRSLLQGDIVSIIALGSEEDRSPWINSK